MDERTGTDRLGINQITHPHEHLRMLRDQEQLLDELIEKLETAPRGGWSAARALEHLTGGAIVAAASALERSLFASNRVVALCQRGKTAEATVYAESARERGLITEEQLETACRLIEDYDAGRRPQLHVTEVML